MMRHLGYSLRVYLPIEDITASSKEGKIMAVTRSRDSYLSKAGECLSPLMEREQARRSFLWISKSQREASGSLLYSRRLVETSEARTRDLTVDMVRGRIWKDRVTRSVFIGQRVGGCCDLILA